MSHATVLIVEDEPEVADVLAFNLRAAGFETVTAPDGLTACRSVGRRPPDLVLLDVLLPDLQGWEICRLIRAHADPAVATLPVVMLTALASAEDRLRGLELGADDYLPKPFSVREVVLKVRNLIRRRQTTEASARRLRDLERDRQADRDLQGLLFHELSNKLVVIDGFSKRLAAQADTGERSRRYADAIRQASRYLSALAEQVALLRQAEGGNLELPAGGVDVDAVAASVAELHRAIAADKGIRLRLEGTVHGRTAHGNALALRVCLSNLVENAIRYSPAGTTVAVRSSAANGRVTLEVEDEGPGIPESERDRVFERFYRGRGAQGVRGTGLGLHLVRILARAMGGEATVSGRPGASGTRATLRLPRNGRGAAPSPEAASGTPIWRTAPSGPVEAPAVGVAGDG